MLAVDSPTDEPVPGSLEALEKLAERRGVKLFDACKPSLSSTRCRWPLRGEGVAFIVCGAPTAGGGTSYCEEHHRIAFTSPRR